MNSPDINGDNGFGLNHLPYGIFRTDGRTRVGVRFGESVFDVAAAFPEWAEAREASLNPLLHSGPTAWAQWRGEITEYLTAHPVGAHLIPLTAVQVLLPIEVADYVDFYASEHHASNLGRLFRPDSPPLLPNWKHLPIGYHGRAGTVVVSGTTITRPRGQRKAPDASVPTFGPSVKLDIEAELGFVVGVGSEQGTSVAATAFADHVFGVALVNDWSARDLQPWEQVPLGPFLAKSFATSMSGWITPLAALDAARVTAPPRDVPVLDYLAEGNDWGLDIAMEVEWNGQLISRPPFAAMYWTAAQMLAHLTANGASLRTGDLFASGTVSGPDPDTVGSLIELTGNGHTPVTINGTERTFLADGDRVTIRATAPAADGGRLRLGEVTGTVAG